MWLAQVCVDGTYPWTLARLSATVLMLGLALIMGLGVMFVSLRLYDGKPTQLLDIFDPLPLFWGYAGVMIIYMLAVLVGLSVLILPGVVLASGFVLAVFIVLETNADPVLALMQSWRLTRGHKLNIAVFIGCSMFLNFVGMLLFGLGLLVTVPVTCLAHAYVYRYFVPKK
jgi:uncharacterized membrane protein